MKLRKIKKFANRFTDKHGDDAVKVFEDTLWETGSLSQVAKQFHFTRTYASQVFSKLFPMTFKEYDRIRSVELSKPSPEKIKSNKTVKDLELL